MQTLRYLVLMLALGACSAVAHAQNLPPISANTSLGAQDAGACVTAGAYASWAVPTVSALAFNVSGTYSGTLTFYGQVNGAWVSMLVSNLSTGAQSTTTTTTGNFSAPNPGLTAVCVSFTTKSSGTPVISATQGYGVSRLTPVAPAFPATFTAGDLLYASATTTVSGLADAAAGQVLASGGVGAAPAYTATPTLTTVTTKAGSGTGTFKVSGQLCDTAGGTCSCTTFTDAGVQNQWNVLTCTVPASTLAANGDELRVTIDYEAAANANTKEMQMFWNGGTCSGNSAALCSTGTTIWGAGVTNASSGVSMTAQVRIKRTASGTQTVAGTLRASTAIIGQDAKSVSVIDTNTIAVSFGIRNTSAAAASTQTPTPAMTIVYQPQ